jgi:hypothetical protein
MLDFQPPMRPPELEDTEDTVAIGDPPHLRRLWRWGLVGLCALACLMLVGLGAELLAAGPTGPPAPEPIRVVGVEAPLPLPEPVVERSVESRTAAEADSRRASVAPVTPTPVPRRPRLRSKDAGVAPRRVQRKSLGTIATPKMGEVLLVATFGGQPVRAEVVIGGVHKGATPLTVSLPAGDHEIRFDYGPTRVNRFGTIVLGGKRVRMEVELRSLAEVNANRPDPRRRPSAHHH